MNLGSLPLWKGVQEQPGCELVPFALGVEDGLIRLDVDSETIYRIEAEYGRDDYTFITAPPGTSSWGNRLGELYFNRLVEAVGAPEGKTVLEIGSGTLFLSERLRKELKARLVIACDPALREVAGTDGVEVVREYFSAERFEGVNPDLIISINNLEHIADPYAYVAAARELLEASGGSLFVVVPDCSRGLRAGDVGICLHEHMSYFTPTSLAALLSKCGFAVKWTRAEEDTIFVAASPGRESAIPALPAEDGSALLGAFESGLERTLEHARRLLNGGEFPLGIHGCGVGLNNYLGMLELPHGAEILLFDGDEQKTGKYLPTFPAPIRSAEDPAYARVGRVVISAPTYFGEIAAFLERRHGIAGARVASLVPLGGG